MSKNPAFSQKVLEDWLRLPERQELFAGLDLTFQMNYVTAFWHVCSQKNYAKTAVHFFRGFLGHPLA